MEDIKFILSGDASEEVESYSDMDDDEMRGSEQLTQGQTDSAIVLPVMFVTMCCYSGCS